MDKLYYERADYSVVVKNRAPPPKAWRWEIYRAGNANPIKQSPIYFDTTAAARRAGKDALKELLNKLFTCSPPPKTLGILPRRLHGHGGAVVVATNDAAPTQRPRLRNAMIASDEVIAGAPGSLSRSFHGSIETATAIAPRRLQGRKCCLRNAHVCSSRQHAHTAFPGSRVRELQRTLNWESDLSFQM
jgi:hypothetical protein